ncbi:MAG: anti-sigma factor [Actinomycetota bacterium]
MTHNAIRQLLGVYAVGALEPVERTEVGRHLELCSDCATEVADHLQTLDALVTAVSPPKALWDRIVGATEETPPPLNLIPISQASSARRSVSFKFAAGFAAAAAIVVGVLGNQVIQQGQRLDRISATSAYESLFRAAAEASANPRGERIELRSPDESLIANIVILSDGTGFIVRDNLPALSAERTYQLWALVNDSRISLGVLGTDPEVAAFRAVAPSKGFAITEEAAGGVATTSKAPVVVGLRRA